MKVLVLAAFLAAATARPDVSLGYRYDTPTSSYGAPFGSVGNLNSGSSHFDGAQSGSSQSGVASGSLNLGGLQTEGFTSGLNAGSLQTGDLHTVGLQSGGLSTGLNSGVLNSESFQTDITSGIGGVQDGSFSTTISPISISNGGTIGLTGFTVTPGPSTTRQYYHVEKQGSITPGGIAPTIPSTSFQIPLHEHTAFTGLGNGASFGLNTNAGNNQLLERINSGAFDNGNSFNLPTGNIGSFDARFNNQGTPGVNLFNTGSLGGLGQVTFDSQSNFGQTQPKEVNRNLYFFSAPDEPQEVHARVNIPPPAKKNVKVLFIKAPSFPTTNRVQIPAQPQDEEKTIVYVLVKKPEDETHIEAATVPPTVASKPEVFFIKYKTQKEAEEAISNVQSGVNSGGASISANSLEGNQDFINTIGQGINTQGGQGISFISTGGGETGLNSGQSFTVNQQGSGITGDLPTIGNSFVSGGLGLGDGGIKSSGFGSDSSFTFGSNGGSQGVTVSSGGDLGLISETSKTSDGFGSGSSFNFGSNGGSQGLAISSGGDLGFGLGSSKSSGFGSGGSFNFASNGGSQGLISSGGSLGSSGFGTGGSLNLGSHDGSQGLISSGGSLGSTGFGTGGSLNLGSSDGSQVVTVSNGNLGLGGSTTVSSLDSLSFTNTNSANSGVHQTYGPPKTHF